MGERKKTQLRLTREGISRPLAFFVGFALLILICLTVTRRVTGKAELPSATRSAATAEMSVPEAIVTLWPSLIDFYEQQIASHIQAGDSTEIFHSDNYNCTGIIVTELKHYRLIICGDREEERGGR